MAFDARTLNPGDIFTINESICISSMVKAPETEGRRFKVVQLFKDYVLCEATNGCYRECFSYTSLNQNVVKVKRCGQKNG